MKSINDIIFDFDGIIVDSEYYFYLSAKEALSSYMNMDEDYYYKYWTNQGNGLKREALKLNLKEPEIEDIKEKIKNNYDNYVNNNSIKAYKEIPEIIDILLSYDKKLHIASNTKKEILLKLLTQNNISISKFTTIHGKTKYLRSKPHPDIFLKALKYIKSPSDKIIIIEDTDKGTIAAHKAGIKSMAIRNSHNQTASFSHCQGIFQGHKDFLSFLGSIFESYRL